MKNYWLDKKSSKSLRATILISDAELLKVYETRVTYWTSVRQKLEKLKLQKLEELKLQVMAANPYIGLGVKI